MQYTVNKNNPFEHKAKNCIHAGSYTLACIQCQTYKLANTPEHESCFTAKPIQWAGPWIKFDDVLRMYSVP